MIYCVQIPQGKIDLLPANFFVNNLLSVIALHEDSGGSSLECDNCESGDAPVNRCTTCSHFLCEFCTISHKRGRNTSSHSLMTLEEAKKMGSAAVTKPAICKEHDGEVIKLFCETCEEAICRDCTIVEHRDHKYTFVKDAFAKGKESLLKILSDTETKATALKEAIDGVLEMKGNVDSYAEETVQEVDKCFKNLTACLNNRRGQLISEIRKFNKQKLKSLESQQEKLETAFAKVQSSLDFTKKALENGSEVEILNMQRHVSSRLQDLNSTKWQLEPCVNEGIKFTDDKQLEHYIKTFGNVTDKVSLACAFLSTVTMENGEEGVMYNTLCGQPVNFIINAKEHTGRIRQMGTSDVFNVLITPVNSHSGNTPVNQNVQDCGNGTYSFCHTPTQAGHYKLSVQLRNGHVKGSPFTWIVEKWTLQTFSPEGSEGQLQLLEENLTAQYKQESSRGRTHQPVYNEYGHSSCSDRGSYIIAVGYVGFTSGKHFWKFQIHGELSFGVITSRGSSQRKMLLTQNSKWLWNSRKKQHTRWSYYGEETSCASDNIVELYLDCERETLKMHNPRTGQSDAWDGVKGEVSPLFQLAKNGDRVSLKIKNVLQTNQACATRRDRNMHMMNQIIFQKHH